MTNKVDMTQGPFLKKIIVFAIPLAISSILQLLFNAADVIVVGQFAGANSLAAVGSTTSLINLIINLFVGISIGSSVILGQYIGKDDFNNCCETVKTSIFIALIAGVVLLFVGVAISKVALQWMGSPDEVIDLATTYLRIYFLGMPGLMLYDFGSALLRAVGDTKRPLYYLFVAGVINVIFNLIFVIVFHLDVAGVAIATVMSQYVSAILILLSLMHSDGFLHVQLKELSFNKDIFKEIVHVGLPAGLQGVVFNISNVLIQSSINSFGSIAMAGNTAASNIEGFVYVSMNAFYQACLSFSSTNYGAKKYHNVNRVLLDCEILVAIVGLILGIGAYLNGSLLLRIYNNDPQVIQYGLQRLSLVSATYFLCGIMDVFVGALRGIGYSVVPMFVSLTGACLFRIIWIFTIFQVQRTQFILLLSYPISWILTGSAHFITYLIVRRKLFKTQSESI